MHEPGGYQADSTSAIFSSWTKFLAGTRQKPFELVALCAVRIEQLHGRSPLRSEALEGLRLLLDVDLHRDEVVIDETLHTWVSVNLGIQPSAAPSNRRSIEIQQ